jgi:hypothetical protein
VTNLGADVYETMAYELLVRLAVTGHQRAQFINATRVAFLAHDLRSVAAAERERCAKLCEGMAEEWLSTPPLALKDAARRIRGGT